MVCLYLITKINKTFLASIGIVLVCSTPEWFSCLVCVATHAAAHRRRLTALLVDDALLRLLSVELAQRAVLGILFDVSLPGPHPHPAGHAAGGPADPLGHHARRRLCRRREGTTKSSSLSPAVAAWRSSWSFSLILSATSPDDVTQTDWR